MGLNHVFVCLCVCVCVCGGVVGVCVRAVKKKIEFRILVEFLKKIHIRMQNVAFEF